MAMVSSLPPNMKEFATELYEKYKKTVWLTANKILHDDKWASEVVQEVYLKLFNRIDRLAQLEEEKRKAYIIIATKNSAFTFLS